MSTLRFTPRWKEELVVTGPGGSFILELPMGELTACLPTEEAWRRQSPAWAVDLWSPLKVELEAWCAANDAALVIDGEAQVWPFDEEASSDGRAGLPRWLWLSGALLLSAAGALWLLRS